MFCGPGGIAEFRGQQPEWFRRRINRDRTVDRYGGGNAVVIHERFKVQRTFSADSFGNLEGEVIEDSLALQIRGHGHECAPVDDAGFTKIKHRHPSCRYNRTHCITFTGGKIGIVIYNRLISLDFTIIENFSGGKRDFNRRPGQGGYVRQSDHNRRNGGVHVERPAGFARIGISEQSIPVDCFNPPIDMRAIRKFIQQGTYFFD